MEPQDSYEQGEKELLKAGACKVQLNFSVSKQKGCIFSDSPTFTHLSYALTSRASWLHEQMPSNTVVPRTHGDVFGLLKFKATCLHSSFTLCALK